MLEPPLQTKPELDRLRDDLRRIELYNGTLVAGDGQSTVILVGVPSGVDRSQFYRKILQIITAKKTVTDEIAVTGAPVAESLFGIQILEDLGVPGSVLGAGATVNRQCQSKQAHQPCRIVYWDFMEWYFRMASVRELMWSLT
jgi:hypothetical protein